MRPSRSNTTARILDCDTTFLRQRGVASPAGPSRGGLTPSPHREAIFPQSGCASRRRKLLRGFLLNLGDLVLGQLADLEVLDPADGAERADAERAAGIDFDPDRDLHPGRVDVDDPLVLEPGDDPVFEDDQ